MKYILLLTFTFLILNNFGLIAQKRTNGVEIIGEMKNVKWKGELSGIINLDTIKNKPNLYGFGPVEYLAGEILIIDGISYKSTVVSPTEIKIEETYNIKAPFFAYANIEKWLEKALPNNVQTLEQLEQYLDEITKSSSRPFMFKLSGTVDTAKIHIVNLPKGSKVSSPKEAHEGQIDYILANEPSQIVGFFSTEHKAIFTHHDTFLHMHLITNDRQQMGHLDEVTFDPSKMKLYLPAE
jgi:acetolactate decarboxylase